MPAHRKDKRLRKRSIHLQLPAWLLDYLDARQESRPVLIERALIDHYNLRPPIVDKQTD